MVKKNKQNKPTTARPAKSGGRRRAARQNKAAHPLMGVAHDVCTLTNPFCPSARGAKWPDRNTAPTISATLEGAVTVTTDANGNAMLTFSPNLTAGIYSYTVNGTTGAGSSPVQIVYSGYDDWTPSEYRIVTAGIEVLSTVSMTASQGIYRVCQLGSRVAAVIPNAFSFQYPALKEKPLREDGQLCAVFMEGGPESRNFQPWVDSEPENTYDWSSLMVAITGAPASTAVARIHYTINVEMRFDASNAMNRLAKPSPGPKGFLTDIVSGVVANFGGVIEGKKAEVEKSIKDRAIKESEKLLFKGFKAIAPGWMGAGASALAPMIMDVD